MIINCILPYEPCPYRKDKYCRDHEKAEIRDSGCDLQLLPTPKRKHISAAKIESSQELQEAMGDVDANQQFQPTSG